MTGLTTLKKGLLVAALAVGAASTGWAQPVAGTTTLGVTATEVQAVATGWSLKKSVLGKSVYNEEGKSVGKIDDVIVAPDKAVSYAIIGAGGFLGLGKHDVAIPVNQFRVENDKIMLPGATKDALKALPKFEYAKKK
jgi:sporulation protein YlmC with PRC-barrel domain